MLVAKIYDTVYNNDKFFSERARNWFFELVKMTPVIGSKVKSKLEECKSIDLVSKLDVQWEFQMRDSPVLAKSGQIREILRFPYLPLFGL